jgi:hypothetical protein
MSQLFCDECGAETLRRMQKKDKWVCMDCFDPSEIPLIAGKVLENYQTDLKILGIENQIKVMKDQTSALTKAMKELKSHKNGIIKDIREGQKQLFE